MKQNKDLKKIYDGIFKKGENTHFTKMSEKKGLPSDERESLKEIKSWKGKRVLDVGCGTGLFAHEAAKKGALVLGIDYSREGIEVAKKEHQHKNLEFKCMDVKDLEGDFDVIVSLGTLEHMDDPFAVLNQLKKHLSKKGSMIFTCPNWINPRGFMLMTLLHLFDAPITLADIHYISPVDFTLWAKKLKMKLSWRTFDKERAHGLNLIKDFEKRIPNVLRDAKLPNNPENIKNFLNWIEKQLVSFSHDSKHSGATALYRLK